MDFRSEKEAEINVDKCRLADVKAVLKTVHMYIFGPRLLSMTLRQLNLFSVALLSWFKQLVISRSSETCKST